MARFQGYKQVSFKSLGGGLNMRDAPGVVDESQAIDLLNVLFSENGAVRQRDGYAQYTAAQLTNRPDSIFPYYSTGGARQLLVGNSTRIDVIDTAGAVAASLTGQTASPHYFARIGSGTESVYISNGADQVKRWDGTSFASPTSLATQLGKFVAVQTPDNRLVNANGPGAGSRVWFSNPGAPETFASTNWVDIRPGDGEQIMGLATYRDKLYVFKETCYAVFFGNSVSRTGTTVFNYRVIEAGVGLAAPRALAVGRDGVYFMDRRGFYRTRELDAPEYLSQEVEPLWTGQTSVYFKSAPLNHAQIANAVMTWHDERIYLSFPTATSTNDRTLVYDPRYHWWSLYDLPAGCMCSWRPSTRPELFFGYATGNKHVARHSSSYIADAMTTTGTGGNAITARWRSGWFDYGTPDPKTIRQSKLWGSGSFSFAVAHDFRDTSNLPVSVTFSSSQDLWADGTDPSDLWADGTNTSDLWGPAGGIAPKLIRGAAIRGSTFSVSFSNSTLNKTFGVYRLAHYIRESRPTSGVLLDVST